MSKSNNTNIIKSESNTNQLIIHQINQVNVDRTPKDVQTLRQAHRSAESVYYPNRSRLIDLYEDVWLDGHLTGIWQKRVSDTISNDIKYLDKSGKEVEGFNKLFETEEWYDLLAHIMDSKLWGLTGIQFIPGKKFNYELIPRKHVLIEKCQIKINQSDSDGRDYTTDPFVWVVGKKHELGLMLKCSFYALIKKGNFGDWAQYSEIFGQPIRVVKYDAYDDKTRIQLQQVLDESGSSLALMIPKQAEFDIMDGKTSNGNGELQEKLKNACNNEMSVVILGNTETTTSDNGGSNAKAQTQSNEQKKLTKGDIRFLLSQLNDDKFTAILQMYGYPVQDGGRFTIHQEADPYKIKALVDLAIQVRNAGTPVSDDHIYDIANIPKPDDYAQQIAKSKEDKEQFKEDLKPNQKPINKAEDLSAPAPKYSLFSRLIRTFLSKKKHKIAPSAFMQNMEELYKDCCATDLNDDDDGNEWFTLDDAYTLIDNVFNQKYEPNGIDDTRTKSYAKAFTHAISTGWSQANDSIGIDFESEDTGMIRKLMDNVWEFSAAKSRTEIIELNRLLISADGKTVDYDTFKINAAQVVDKFQNRYLKTEYNNAVNSSYLAARWDEMEDNDIITFRTAGDSRVRYAHQILNGISLPKSHRFWRTFYPPLAWNCRCTVYITHSGRITQDHQIPWSEVDNVQPLFRSNFAIDGMAFPPNHPYYNG